MIMLQYDEAKSGEKSSEKWLHVCQISSDCAGMPSCIALEGPFNIYF